MIRTTRLNAAVCTSIRPLIVLQYDALDDVCHAFSSVGGVFEDLVKFLPLDHRDRVSCILEQFPHRPKINIIRDIFEPMDLDKMSVDPVGLAQHRNGTDYGGTEFLDRTRKGLGVVVDLADVEHHYCSCSRVDVITDIVECDRESVDILPIERRDERFIQLCGYLVGELIASVFHVFDPLCE